MAQIKINLTETLLDGMDIKFQAPCSCSEVTGLIVYYPAADESIASQEFSFRDSHGNDLTGVGNLFSKGAYVKVIVDITNSLAYIQNADTNGYLEARLIGEYTHTAEGLIGKGANGKFKATVSGPISSMNVNGAACSVKCGEESSVDLIAGCWYTFILEDSTIHFGQSGGFSGTLEKPLILIEGIHFGTEEQRPAPGTPGRVWYQKVITDG